MDSLLSNFTNVTNSTNNSTQTVPTAAPSEPAMTESSFFKWFRFAAYSVICISGVFGNLLVLLASRKPGMVTVSNILIANLAVADFTVSLINIPTVVVYSHLVYWPFGAFLCKLIPFLQGLTLSASVGTLMAIALERYWHIVLYTRRKLTVREAYKAVAVIWASSIFIPLPLALFYKIIMGKQGDKSVAFCVEEWAIWKARQAYTALLFLLMYCLPLLLISGLYIRIGSFLRSLPPIRRVTSRAQRKAVRMLMIVVVLFGFCWLPYHIVYMYLDFSQSQLTQALTSFVLFVQWLMFANSACNPFVYAVLNDNFRREFAAMISRRTTDRRRSDNMSIRIQTIQSASQY